MPGITILITAGVIVGLAIYNSPHSASPTPAAPPTHTTVPTPAASARPPAHADPFGTAAAAYLAARTGTALAAVYDLRTGQTWSVGSGPPQAEASVVKLDVLETLLAQRGGGSAGLAASDRALAEQMIEDSDNDAATSLWYEVGGPDKIRAFNASAGLTKTSPSSCVVCPGFAWPGWGLTTTVPADQIALLRELVEPGPLLTPADRSYALSLMENVTPFSAVGGFRRRPGRDHGGAEERLAPARQRGHELADQQRRVDLGRWPRLPDGRAEHREPDGAVRRQHDRHAGGPRLAGHELT